MDKLKLWHACAFYTMTFLIAVRPAAHATGPVPPCAGAPVPAYSALGAPPNIAVFRPADPGGTWPIDVCAGLSPHPPALLIALSGRFLGPQDRDVLLTRIGAISMRIGTRYWSVTDRAWETLVSGAYALTGPRLDSRRPDFTADEMKSDQELYYAQDDNRSSSPVVYAMRIRKLTPRSFILEGENVTPVRYFFLTMYRPGDLSSEVFLRKQASGEWDYYSLTGVAAELGPFGGSERSYINRAVAQFRYIAGIATDQEPPAAP
jgi:hypothetical protein